MANIYDNPEKFGLTLLKHHDIAGGYEFDAIIVLKDRHGRFLIAHDSGCSCPEPFGGVGVDDLDEVKTLADVAEYARRKWDESEYYGDGEDQQKLLETRVAGLVGGLVLA